jgi:capsid portal protein
VLAGCFIPHKLLSRQAFSAFALDWFVFGNAYLEMRRNRLHGPMGFRNSLAKYTRRGSDLDTYWFIQSGLDDHQFETGSVCHVINPDIHQIYGMPEYFAGCCRPTWPTPPTSSASSTTTTGRMQAVLRQQRSGRRESLENLKKTLTDTRRGGAFKNILLSAPASAKTPCRSCRSARYRRRMSLSA